MTSQKLWLPCVVLTCLVFANAIGAAEAPTVAFTMGYVPSQKDVEFETPKPAEFAKCKVDVERKGKINGWVVLGPAGQVLRKFLDTDGDGNLDQFRFFNQGIEVYRDIDSNKNKKIDQCRWLNLGGSRWGIDLNEDGRIDRWKVISAAETSREAIRAMIAGDEAALNAIMITSEDLKYLGVHAQLGQPSLLESAAEPGKKGQGRDGQIEGPHISNSLDPFRCTGSQHYSLGRRQGECRFAGLRKCDGHRRDGIQVPCRSAW